MINGARVSAINSFFLSNMAGQGGAVAVFGEGSFSAHNSVFEGNTADAGAQSTLSCVVFLSCSYMLQVHRCHE